MIILKIILGIIIWFVTEISIALGVSVGLRVYFDGRMKNENKSSE